MSASPILSPLAGSTALLLRALAAQEEPALRQWFAAHALREPVAQWLLDQQLGPFVHDQLRRFNLLDRLPAPLRPSFERDYYLTSTQYTLAVYELQHLLADLRAVDIEPIILKGLALAGTVYPSPATRPMGDLDFAVTEAQIPGVRRVFSARGYQDDGLHTDRAMSIHQELSFWRQLPGGQRLLLEAHWHLFVEPHYRTLDLSAVWARAVPVQLEGVRCLMLHPADQLIYACGHLLLKHTQQWNLMWLLDLKLLVDHYGETWDWRMVVQRAAALQLAGGLRCWLELAEDWFGPFLSDVARRELAAGQPAPAELRYIPLVNATMRPTRQTLLDRFVRIKGWRGKWLFISTGLFPPWDYMQYRYGARSRLAAPLYYAWRLIQAVPVLVCRKARRPAR